MMDWLKKSIFRWYNPRAARTKDGYVIPDIKRRRHSKEIQKKIDSGELKTRKGIKCRDLNGVVITTRG